jgi:hypothetical protein
MHCAIARICFQDKININTDIKEVNSEAGVPVENEKYCWYGYPGCLCIANFFIS